MSHAARHAAQKIEFLIEEDLVFEGNLIRDQCEVLSEGDEELRVISGERRAIGFFPEDEQAVRLVVHQQRECDVTDERSQLLAGFGFEALRVRTFGAGVEGKMILSFISEETEDRRVTSQVW